MFHVHNNPNVILSCPDCSSINIYPVENQDRYTPYTGDLQDSLYNGEQHPPSTYHEINFKDAYEDRYGYAPKLRQKHFYCDNCLDQMYKHESYYPGHEWIPIFPFNHLHKIDISQAPKLEEFNPYDEIFSNFKK